MTEKVRDSVLGAFIALLGIIVGVGIGYTLGHQEASKVHKLLPTVTPRPAPVMLCEWESPMVDGDGGIWTSGGGGDWQPLRVTVGQCVYACPEPAAIDEPCFPCCGLAENGDYVAWPCERTPRIRELERRVLLCEGWAAHGLEVVR